MKLLFKGYPTSGSRFEAFLDFESVEMAFPLPQATNFIINNRTELLNIERTILNDTSRDSYGRWVTDPTTNRIFIQSILNLMNTNGVIRSIAQAYERSNINVGNYNLLQSLLSDSSFRSDVHNQFSRGSDAYPAFTPHHIRRKVTEELREPENNEEKVVNVEELSELLATTRLKEQGLVLEKEPEKYKRFLKEYSELINQCVSTKEVNSNEKESSSDDNEIPTIKEPSFKWTASGAEQIYVSGIDTISTNTTTDNEERPTTPVNATEQLHHISFDDYVKHIKSQPISNLRFNPTNKE